MSALRRLVDVRDREAPGLIGSMLAVVPLRGALVASVPRGLLVPIARFFALTKGALLFPARPTNMKSLVVPAIFIGISVYILGQRQETLARQQQADILGG